MTSFAVDGGTASTAPTLAVTDTDALFQLETAISVASTSGTSIDFVGLPASAKRLTVIFSEVSTNGTSKLLVQIGSGSVSSSGYVSTSNDLNQSSSTGGANSTAGFIMSQGSSADRSVSGQMVITRMSDANYVGFVVGKSFTTQMFLGGGSVTLTGVADRIRVTTVSGADSFDAGTINIMFE